MDAFKFNDIKVEKANAISRYRRIQRITNLFRFIELFVVLIIAARFSAQFALPLKVLEQYLQRISVSLVSPQFVFLVMNAIVIILFLRSGGFSGGKIDDIYEEYVRNCRQNLEGKASEELYRNGVCYEEKKMNRSNSVNVERNTRRRELRRSMTEKCKESPSRRLVAAEEMSGEEFRRKVEAFIARQQKFLRESD